MQHVSGSTARWKRHCQSLGLIFSGGPPCRSWRPPPARFPGGCLVRAGLALAGGRCLIAAGGAGGGKDSGTICARQGSTWHWQAGTRREVAIAYLERRASERVGRGMASCLTSRGIIGWRCPVHASSTSGRCGVGQGGFTSLAAAQLHHLSAPHRVSGPTRTQHAASHCARPHELGHTDANEARTTNQGDGMQCRRSIRHLELPPISFVYGT